MESNSSIQGGILLIRHELSKLERVVNEIAEFQPQEVKKDLYSSVLLLQSFYTGVENVLKRALKLAGCALPAGEMWHSELLQLAAKERPGSYPAIISEPSKKLLDELRGFRHVARTHYGAELDAERVVPVIEKMNQVWPSFHDETEAFLRFLEEASR